MENIIKKLQQKIAQEKIKRYIKARKHSTKCIKCTKLINCSKQLKKSSCCKKQQEAAKLLKVKRSKKEKKLIKLLRCAVALQTLNMEDMFSKVNISKE